MKFLLASLLALAAPVFSATIVADQFTGIPEESGFPSVVGPVQGEFREDISMAQTITVGVEGYLSRIDVWMGRHEEATGDLVLSILNTADGAPVGAPLMTVNIASSSIASSSLFEIVMVSVDVRSWNLHYSAGDTFAIALGAPDAPAVGTGMPAFTWDADGVGGYTAGERYFRSTPEFPDWTSSEGTMDLLVRTWVEPVPEPSCLVLAGAGLLVVRRRRRNAEEMCRVIGDR